MSGDPPTRALKHWLGFLGSGTLAFVTDAAVLKFLVAFGGWDRLSARLASIACAMVTAWIAHRTFTFAVTAKPTLAEFGRFVRVAGTANAVNYLLYKGILYVRPPTDELVALVLATGVATVVSYLGLRFNAFKRGE